MSKNDSDYEVVTPSSIDTDTDDESQYDSPAERVNDAFGDRIGRDWAVAGDDHPLVKTAGTAEALRSSVPEKVQKMLAEDLYQDPDVFWREWLQNHEAACIREAKRVVKNAHGEDALYVEIEHEHESLAEPRIVRLPKQAEDLLPMARDLGYDPVIEFEVDVESRTITTRDNGIGMTTGEAIEVWNEPVESTSGTDLSSAGNKGIGALTWNSVSEDDAGIFVKTKTRRDFTLHSDEVVPPHDREGYNFFSYLGGIVPLPGGVEDSFYGTEFQIPVGEHYDLGSTRSSLEKYLELSPIKTRWVETRGSETVADEEWEPTTFFDQYTHPERDAPAVRVHRPGEYSLALDQPDVVPKGYNDTDTWLVDMPIDRNLRHRQSLDTLFNDHLQVHNEQGLIIAGPNRGRLEQQVEDMDGVELHEDDVVMPTPTADRDRLARGDDHEAFFEHLNTVAMEEERRVASDLIEKFFSQPDVEAATKFISDNVNDFELALRFLNKHYSCSTTRPKEVLEMLIKNPEFDVDDDVPRKAIKKTGRSKRGRNPDPSRYNSPPAKIHSKHDLWPLVQLFTDLQTTVSYAVRGTINPDKKTNRTSKELYLLLNSLDQRIYVAKQISEDRAKVVWNTYPDAIILKVKNYGDWMREPYNAQLLKNVPFKESNNEDGEYDIPAEINDAHTYNAIRSDVSELPSEPMRIRSDNSSTAVDSRHTIDELTDILDATDFGDQFETTPEGKRLSHRGTPRGLDAESHRYMVVFPDSRRAENISEHYGWQAHAALVRGSVGQCERLLEYPQVFKPVQFKSFLSDQTIPVVDSFDDTHGQMTISDALDADRDLLLMQADSRGLIDIMYGGWKDSWLDGSDARKKLARKNFMDAAMWSGYKNPLGPKFVCPACGDGFNSKRGRSLHYNYCDEYDNHDEDDPSEWMFSHPSKLDVYNIVAYADLVGDDVVLRCWAKTPRSPLALLSPRTQNYEERKHSVRTASARNMEKAMWQDVWPLDSDSWERIRSDHYLKGLEKEMLRMLRSHGIDPADFDDRYRNPKAINYVLEKVCDF